MTSPDRRACPGIISPSRGCPSAGRARYAGTHQCRDLLDDLAQIADPRHRRGRRHTLVAVLAVAVCAVLAGARSLAAIGAWASDAPCRVLAALGVRRDP
jgi:DDE_Tnp_1-associated